MKRPTYSKPMFLNDPAAPSLLLFAVIVVAGFLAIGVGWKVAARTLFVQDQTPALVSGGLGGLSLVLLGCAFASVQSGRRLAALERLQTEAVLDEAAGLLEAVKAKRGLT